MKKLILLFVILIGITKIQAQNNVIGLEDPKLTVGGLFETVFDQYGNKYSLDDIKTNTPKKSKLNNTSLSSTSLCTSGIFELYFEDGSGMEVVSDPTQNAINTARRNVACQVFTDLSNFINTPLKNAGNTTKVKIWVRDIDEVSNEVLGLATSFYNMPYNTTVGFGGIADNEIWKTIHAGKDSYINVATPIVSNGVNSGVSGLLYHGMMAFNFNSISNWNTNLSINSPAGQYDLYSVILHEVTHALGFASLINADGTSKFGAGFNYYSRYDTFLKNNSNSQFLISNTGNCSLYNYSFNTSLNSSVLQPNPSSCITQQTTCSTAIKFVGTSTVPVYTPNCFDPPSSLSHFEDQCIGAPNGNNTNAYFTMTDANGTGVTKRFLKFEERNALGDIGYQLNTTFGNNTTALGSYNNYGGVITTGINVAGINDGINSDGTLKYIANSGTQIVINSSTNSLIKILSNDTNANGFECLQDVYDNTATLNGLTSLSGNDSTNVIYTSSISGLHLLRYVPVNAAGQKGNITYIYVYFINSTNCATPSSCNLVMNGGFEQNSGLPIDVGNFNLICGWTTTAIPASSSSEYYNALAGNWRTQIPCNVMGYQTVNNSAGNSYAGLWTIKNYFNSGLYTESINTKLSSALLPNTAYQLSFDVSLAEGGSSSSIKFQAYLGSSQIVTSGLTSMPINNPNMLFNSSTFSTNTNNWERVTINFTTNSVAGEQYLYIGGLDTTVSTQSITPAGSNVGGCAYFTESNTGQWVNMNASYYYLDNVSLVPVESSFSLPNVTCNSQILTDLTTYVSPIMPNGTFSGSGVSLNNDTGFYSFNANAAGLGVKTLTYTYTNNLNCLVNVYSQITVSDCSSTSCPGNLVFDTTQPTTPANYQAAIDIVTNGNYIVNTASTIDLKAGNSITIDTDSWIKNGSLFLAEIEDCVQTSERLAFSSEESLESEQVSLFPNPTFNYLTVSTQKSEIIKLNIVSIEGKLIFQKDNIDDKNFQLNIENYQKGIYLISIETLDGKIHQRKVIKQ